MNGFSPGDDATRARDADRDIAIGLVDAAFSDGQLTSAEREERNDLVNSAATLGELRSLTKDLQAPATVAPPRRSRRGLVVMLTAAIVAAGVVAGIVLVDEDDPGPPAHAAPTVVDEKAAPPEPTSEPTKAKPKPLRYSFTVRGVKNFVELYRKEFGTTKGSAFAFKSGKVNVARRGDTGEIEHWMYVDGHFVDDGLYSDREFEPGRIDIADLDVEAAFGNLGRVRKRVGIDNPPYFGMSVVVASGKKGVWLVAGDDTDCEADWMSLDGEVQERGTPCAQ